MLFVRFSNGYKSLSLLSKVKPINAKENSITLGIFRTISFASPIPQAGLVWSILRYTKHIGSLARPRSRPAKSSDPHCYRKVNNFHLSRNSKAKERMKNQLTDTFILTTDS